MDERRNRMSTLILFRDVISTDICHRKGMKNYLKGIKKKTSLQIQISASIGLIFNLEFMQYSPQDHVLE